MPNAFVTFLIILFAVFSGFLDFLVQTS